jgi:UDP:flavonoid glycosyltransferase YjiC (YdhE family)
MTCRILRRYGRAGNDFVSRILFAWELGANLGHLMRDLPVARRLRESGHEVLFALPDTRAAQQWLTPDGFKFVAIPPTAERGWPKPLASYPEILAAHGFTDRRALLRLVRAWSALWEPTRPDVVVIDHAPTALLAARAHDIPVVLLGNGFEIPPPVSPLPSIRPWERVSPVELLETETRVLDTLNATLARFGRSALARVADLFANSPAVLTTFAELDPYEARPTAEYVGPIGSHITTPVVDWAMTTKPRIFAYLRPFVPGVQALLGALEKCGAHVICAMPGVSPAVRQHFNSQRFQLFSGPVASASLLPRADIVISYGGPATVATALLAGAPLLLVSHTIEQHLCATRVEPLGAGVVMRKERAEQDFADALTALTSDTRYKEAAQRFAKKYSEFTLDRAVDRTVERVEAAIRAAHDR